MGNRDRAESPTVWPKGLRVTDRHVVVTIRADMSDAAEAFNRIADLLSLTSRLSPDADGVESWELGPDAMRWQP